MGYTDYPLIIKFKKLFRYTLMYGLRRTYIKVVGRLLLTKQRRKTVLAKIVVKRGQIVSIVGCGNYSFTNIAYYLNRAFGKVIISCMDRDLDRAATLSDFYHIPFYSADFQNIIEDQRVKLVYIASNHASHADYAIEALRSGKNVYIEKPPVVSEEQLIKLIEVIAKTEGKVFLGFNRPKSRFGRLIKNYLSHHPGPGMYSWFVAGHKLPPGHWYLNHGEGGRVIGNLCHWTDFLLNLVPEHTFPIKISPVFNSLNGDDLIVAYTFGEGSTAVISFAAKSEPFEGVKERFNAQKGDCLITMTDFRAMTVEISDFKKHFYNFRRDHGHQVNILSAFKNVQNNLAYDRTGQIAYIWNTGWLFLKTKEALEKNRELMIHSFEERHRDLKRSADNETSLAEF